MKNSFKLGVLALAIAVSFAACKGNGSAGGDTSKTKTDSPKMDTSKTVDTSKMKKDTGKMADTSKKK